VETIRAWLGTIRNETEQAQGRKRRETGNETGTSKQNRKRDRDFKTKQETLQIITDPAALKLNTDLKETLLLAHTTTFIHRGRQNHYTIKVASRNFKFL